MTTKKHLFDVVDPITLEKLLAALNQQANQYWNLLHDLVPEEVARRFYLSGPPLRPGFCAGIYRVEGQELVPQWEEKRQ